jgi:diguanylate cyclase (GGDEF)-like protein
MSPEPAATQRLAPSRVPLRLRVRTRTFDIRLVGTLTATLMLVALLQSQLMASTIERRLFDEAHVDAAGVAAAVGATIADGAGDPDSALAAVAQILAATSATSAVTGARLFDQDGFVVAASLPMLRGMRPRDPTVAAALRDGISYAGKEATEGEDGAYQFVFPLNTSAGRFALEVDRHGEDLAAATRDLRRGALMLLLVGLPVAVPLFYLLGGRSLSARHRLAVRHSTQDSLTGLGNHRAFQERLRDAVGMADERPTALVLLDLDDFKGLNDRAGHREGDRALSEVATILAGLARDAYRIGGDEFALVLRGGTAEGRAAAEHARGLVAERLQGLSLSAGVAALAGIVDADTLRDRADAALFEAKRRGRNAVVEFDDVEEAGTITSSASVRAVRDLLAEGDMDAAFQPIWRPDGATLIGYEGLARPHARHQFSGPMEAFETAARMGRVPELDAVCRHAIFARATRLPASALLFVNLSPEALGHESIAGDTLLDEARAAGLEPEQVVLEITERSITRRTVAIREGARLRALGFRLALDDVGAGNAGLELLRHLPVDFVKIDREVVTGALVDRGARGIYLAIVTFAQQTGAAVIAEGIETSEQLTFVRGRDTAHIPAEHLGVQGVQGYLLGRPAPAMLPAHDHPAALLA